MGWFTKCCRNTGLMIHHIIKPVAQSNKQTISKQVEEKKVNESVTLRRTTIDEIEVKKDET